MFPRALLHAAVVSRLWAPAAAAGAGAGARRALHASAPALGLLDGLKSMVGSQTEAAKRKKMEELFAYQLEFILGTPAYSLLDHTRLLEALAAQSGANGWRTMLMTEAAKGELAEQLVDLKIGAAFTPAEVAGHRHGSTASAINGRARARVAAEVGSDVGRVNRFLDNFRQSALMHEWLHTRKAKGAWLGGRARARADRAGPLCAHLFTPFLSPRSHTPHAQAWHCRGRPRSTPTAWWQTGWAWGRRSRRQRAGAAGAGRAACAPCSRGSEGLGAKWAGRRFFALCHHSRLYLLQWLVRY